MHVWTFKKLFYIYFDTFFNNIKREEKCRILAEKFNFMQISPGSACHSKGQVIRAILIAMYAVAERVDIVDKCRQSSLLVNCHNRIIIHLSTLFYQDQRDRTSLMT